MAVDVMADLIRLDKYLVEMGLGTRSQIKDAAKKGRIQVDGVVEKKTDRKIDPQTETVSYDGRIVSYVKTEYYMLNKPQGVVSATEDNLHRTVLNLITDRQRNDLFPVGRLDIDTEGLLLITNDGDLAHRLLSPKKHVDKVYFARLSGRVPEDAPVRFAEGIQVGQDYKAMPAKLEVVKAEPQESEVLITLREGKFHQVKRMCHEIGCEVVYLKRISMGSLMLDETLAPGECRKLTEEELFALKNS